MSGRPRGSLWKFNLIFPRKGTNMNNFFKRLATGEDGATMVEYGLMIALVGAAVAGTATILAGNIKTAFGLVTNSLTGAS
jgi:Flp pilus assembly pilin Flp